MRARVVERIVWGGALLLALVAVEGWRRSAVEQVTSLGVVDRPPLPVTSLDPDTLDAWESAIVDGDLFRLSRAPSPVAFTTAIEGAPPPPPKPPRPPLAVTGIIGPPWEAILEGAPGREGAVVVRRGDVLGELQVRSVMRDTVVIQGADTTWRLTVRRAW